MYAEVKEFSNPKTLVFKIGMSPLLNTQFIALLTNSYKNSGIEILLIVDNLKQLDVKLKTQRTRSHFVPLINKNPDKNSMRLYDLELFFIDNSYDTLNQDTNAKVQIKDIRDKTFVRVPDSSGLSAITRSLIRTTT
ncbi:MAG: hypothetical protein MJK13_14850, partial [Pseudomonadales bacterium]|nr:hypothetical protein [Pseudomonadales bacterium]